MHLKSLQAIGVLVTLMAKKEPFNVLFEKKFFSEWEWRLYRRGGFENASIPSFFSQSSDKIERYDSKNNAWMGRRREKRQTGLYSIPWVGGSQVGRSIQTGQLIATIFYL